MKRWITFLSLAAGLASAQQVQQFQPTPPSPPAAEAKGNAPDQDAKPAQMVPPAGKILAQDAKPVPANPAADKALAQDAKPVPVVKPKLETGKGEPAPAPVPDKAIPQAYSEEHYASTWRRNPFLLETKPKEGAPTVGFAEDWELKGLTRIQGQPQALLNNKKTQESHWVRTTEDKDGFKLLKATIDRDLHKSSVEVTKAGEAAPATFTFPEVAAAPATGARPGAPVPGVRPGSPMPTPGTNPIRQPGMPNGQVPNNAMRQPGAPPQAAGQPGNGIPRMNPAIQPGAQPTQGTRRRVLIPPTAPR